MGEEIPGKIQIYTGNGKGKTTASLGLAIRGLGAGKKVGIIFFDKGGKEYSERNFLDNLSGRIDYWVVGRDRRDVNQGGFDFTILPQDIKEMKKGLKLAYNAANKGTYDIVILDEINTVTALGMLEVKDIIEFLTVKPFYLEIVLTGRNCPQLIMEKADLVTEMREIKHYYNHGVKAREGIDY